MAFLSTLNIIISPVPKHSAVKINAKQANITPNAMVAALFAILKQQCMFFGVWYYIGCETFLPCTKPRRLSTLRWFTVISIFKSSMGVGLCLE